MAIQFENIEGATPIDPNEADGLIPSYISTQAQLNAAEQANIAEAQAWAVGRKHDSVLSEAFVRDLHKRMFKDVWRWAGVYRKSEKKVGIDPNQIAVQVLNLCADAAVWVRDQSFPWEELGARFHHRLVLIHPFSNGNGRHARLITDLLLTTNGQTAFTWGAATLSDEIDRMGELRKKYIQALRAADKNDFNSLIQFVRS
jgi:Fic-DOC domain mobile mystery protein B